MQTRQELLEQYKKLTSFEQALLQFLSVVYEPAHSTLIVNCLRKLDLKNPRGNKPTTANLTHYFAKFEQLGLLTRDRQCAEEIVEVLSKIAVKQNTFAEYAKVIQEEAPVTYYYGKWTTRCWRGIREMRIGVYTQQFDLIDDAADFIESQCRDMAAQPSPTIRILTQPFDPEWLRSLPTSFQFYLLNDVLQHAHASLADFSEITTFLANEDEFGNLSADEQLPFKRLLFHDLLFRGRLEEAKRLTESHADSFLGTGARGTFLFLSGDSRGALAAYEEDISFLKKFSRNDNVAIFGPCGLFYILTRLHLANKEEFHEIANCIATAQSLFRGARENDAYGMLAEVVASHINKGVQGGDIILPEGKQQDALTVTFAGICQYWLNSALEPDVESEVAALYQKAESTSYRFFKLILGEILSTAQHDDAGGLTHLDDLRTETGITLPILSILAPEEPWKRSLQALIHATSHDEESPQETSRLIWMVGFEGKNITVSPREQRQTPEGEWSKGRPISLSRLYQTNKLNYLTSQDRKICAAIKRNHNPETHAVNYFLDMEKALLAMIGHPNLYLADSSHIPVEFVAGEPELLVEEKGENLHICFAHPITSDNINFQKETPTRVKIISINDNHRRIAQITGKSGITVPKSASDQVLTAIGNISSFMTVHSAIAADSSARQSGNITFVEADSTIHMHLIPYGTGFRLEMFVKPFTLGGHYLKPGQGVENIMAEVGGRRMQTRRNLALEEEKARDIEELCPILDMAVDMEQENDREWHLYDPDDCLQALMELQAIRDKVVIEWPEGEKLTITQKVSLENLNLKIRTNRQNWFAMSGELTLDQGRVIELKELLAKLKHTTGRFVEIGEGQFIALTQEFRKRLVDLNLFSETEDDETEEVLVHPLAAMQLEKLAAQARTVADTGWENQLKRIRDAQSFKPEVPSTLQADLRHYQREGYEWLARLAHWGVGGCLADDMGLGKTLQSLAVILNLAADGPSLVVAPTSVSTNWISEVRRFTPTINIKLFTGRDREKSVRELGKFDLLITTYTLLQQETELLSSIDWQAVILDEAQAIKNSATKRSQAAMALKARFKLITTGTPIENHLGELWNLFHFINPGLLGSLNSFNERFAIPIERYQDREAKRKLRKLIRPFILRRIKSQVLEELPSRTEVTLEVEMNQEESHFYEALRQHALDLLESNRDKRGRHLQILTEIMRLRQACCNPRLIDRNSTIESSKLKVFSSIIEELLESRHKALVFSQFIGHLSFIREYLDRQKISYQYLDGSTSSKQRKQSVDAFQAGEGDLFLISLKAGGLGLNLTAADYVIHMDPWWNPAIEDQASDRAHRIGQTRPVTIYRLVCKDTIEEKIVKLHQEKRDLAGSLLEGSEVSAQMNSEELLDLIRNS